MRRNTVLAIALGGSATLGAALTLSTQRENDHRAPASVPHVGSKSSQVQGQRVLTATPPEPGEFPPSMRVEAEVEAALKAKRPDRAEAVIAAHLTDPALRKYTPLHERHIELLAARGADRAVLAESLDLLRGTFGPWLPSARKLRHGLLAAMRLNATREADELAKIIIGQRDWQFSSFPSLYAPKDGPTTDKRLAYALLSLAHEAEWDNRTDLQIQYNEKARVLAPRDVPVLVQLAAVYSRRRGKGDLERAASLLKQAYNTLPTNSPIRRDLRIYASDVTDVAPDSKVTLAEELRTWAEARHADQVKQMNETQFKAPNDGKSLGL